MCLIVCTLLFSAISYPDDIPSWTPTLLRNESKFRFIEAGLKGDIVTFERLSDNAVITIKATKSSPELASRRPQFSQIDASGTLWSAPSLLPFGRQVRFRKENSIMSLLSINDYDQIDVTLRGHLIIAGKSRAIAPIGNLKADQELVEALSRESFARFAIRRRTSNSIVNIGSKSVPCFVASGTGIKYVDLNAWALARNVVINHNDEAKRFAFQLRGSHCLMCWGTNQIKFENSWKLLPDVVMYDEGKLWVPLVAVEE